jgi:hypothetical protein
MFKAAVVAVVLSLVGGRTVALLCGSWCDQRPMSSTHHHDEARSAVAVMAASDACSGPDLWAGWWREKARRVVPDHERELQLPSFVAQLVGPGGSLSSPVAARIASPLGRRPISTPLRI